MIAEEVDDEDEGKQQQKTASAAESGRVGRPVRSTDVHNVHSGVDGRPAVDRSEEEKLSVSFGRPTRSTDLEKAKLSARIGRPARSTDQKKLSLSKYRSTGPVDRSTGLGKKLLLRKLRSSEYK